MKIKWGNVFLLVIFILSVLNLGYVFIKLCWSIASLSWFGVVTTLFSLMLASVIGEYLIDEMQ